MTTLLSNLKVACILDEFSYECFRHECMLLKIGPSNWKKILAKEKPDLLLVESAWRGNDGAWKLKVGSYKNNDRKDIKELVNWCKNHKIPTVFWNKEDPVHFDFYFETAKLFDYVYTTDKNMIKKYKNKLGHQNVFVLPFAAQPKIHNPLKISKSKEKNICFAGTYYGDHHPERKVDMDILLSVSAKYGLDIFDRNYNIRSNFRFPDEYQKFIKGHMPYNKLVNACKEYKVNLNVNSVKDSPTMCSRRVFELLASGVTVISNQATAIEQTFQGIVPTFNNTSSLDKILKKAIHDENWRLKNELKGIRLVYGKHTYAHRLYQIATNCRINCKPSYNPKLQIIGYANNQQEVEKIIKTYKQQEYKNKALTIFTSFNKSILSKNKIVDVDIINSNKLDSIPILMKLIQGSDYFALFNPSHYYGHHFLTDLVTASVYTDARIIGKGSFYMITDPGLYLVKGTETYSFGRNILNDACIIHRSVLEGGKNIKLLHFIENKVMSSPFRKVSKFSIDPFNFLYDYNKLEAERTELIEQITG